MESVGVILTVHGWVARTFPTSVGIILTGATLFLAVRLAQEVIAPTHKAWRVEAGYSKACLVSGLRLRTQEEQNMAKRDQRGTLGEGERHPIVTVHLYTLAVLLYPSSLNIISYP